MIEDTPDVCGQGAPPPPHSRLATTWQENPDHLVAPFQNIEVFEIDPNFRHCRRALHRLEAQTTNLGSATPVADIQSQR